jgi:CRP-like cAMP-binding protein
MAVASPSDAHPLLAKIESIFPLTGDEREALLHIPMQVTTLRADQDVVREGDCPSRSFLLLEGFACTFKVTGEGKRQILALHVPGDMPDIQSLHLKILDNSIGTMTPCRVGFIYHETLHQLCDRFPRLASAFWRHTLIDAAILREWMISNGRRQAYARMAHLLCELLTRMMAVRLAQDHACDLPVTQHGFGDALGLSTVHVNRILQELREAGLISLRGSHLEALNWDGLKQAGDFDPTYLHLEERQGVE